MSRISSESEPPVRRASESLNVQHEYDPQRRAFREAVCEERAGAAAGAGATRQARGTSSQQGDPEKQRRVCEQYINLSDAKIFIMLWKMLEIAKKN